MTKNCIGILNRKIIIPEFFFITNLSHHNDYLILNKMHNSKFLYGYVTQL